MLAVLTRRVAGDKCKIELPARSEILKTWMLPVMGEALAEDEAESKAFAMLESVKRLRERNG